MDACDFFGYGFPWRPWCALNGAMLTGRIPDLQHNDDHKILPCLLGVLQPHESLKSPCATCMPYTMYASSYGLRAHICQTQDQAQVSELRFSVSSSVSSFSPGSSIGGGNSFVRSCCSRQRSGVTGSSCCSASMFNRIRIFVRGRAHSTFPNLHQVPDNSSCSIVVQGSP